MANVEDVVHETTAWIVHPFAQPIDVTRLFLLVGIVLVMIVLWNMILFNIRIAAEEII